MNTMLYFIAAFGFVVGLYNEIRKLMRKSKNVAELNWWMNRTQPIIIVAVSPFDTTAEDRYDYAVEMLRLSGNKVLSETDVYLFDYYRPIQGQQVLELSDLKIETLIHRAIGEIRTAHSDKYYANAPGRVESDLYGRKPRQIPPDQGTQQGDSEGWFKVGGK